MLVIFSQHLKIAELTCSGALRFKISVGTDEAPLEHFQRPAPADHLLASALGLLGPLCQEGSNSQKCLGVYFYSLIIFPPLTSLTLLKPLTNKAIDCWGEAQQICIDLDNSEA